MFDMNNFVTRNIVINGARIAFRNFNGAEGKFNPAGRRNFCVFLEKGFAEDLASEGWNIRWLKPRDEQEEEQAYMQVAVSFEKVKNIPPLEVTMITSRGKTALDEESVGILDWAEIENADIRIRPYNWKTPDKSGVKGYLASMFVTIVEDELEKKYRDVPENDVASIGEDLCAECGTPCGSKGECRYDG